MADISKCKGTNCPLADTCWRYKAPGNEYYQSYFTEVPYDHKSHGCDHYWQMHEVKNVGS
jgi:hypothetical protein